MAYVRVLTTLQQYDRLLSSVCLSQCSDDTFIVHSYNGVTVSQEYPIELTVLPGKDTAEEMEED